MEAQVEQDSDKIGAGGRPRQQAAVAGETRPTPGRGMRKLSAPAAGEAAPALGWKRVLRDRPAHSGTGCCSAPTEGEDRQLLLDETLHCSETYGNLLQNSGLAAHRQVSREDPQEADAPALLLGSAAGGGDVRPGRHAPVRVRVFRRFPDLSQQALSQARGHLLQRLPHPRPHRGGLHAHPGQPSMPLKDVAASSDTRTSSTSAACSRPPSAYRLRSSPPNASKTR